MDREFLVMDLDPAKMKEQKNKYNFKFIILEAGISHSFFKVKHSLRTPLINIINSNRDALSVAKGSTQTNDKIGKRLFITERQKCHHIRNCFVRGGEYSAVTS